MLETGAAKTNSAKSPRSLASDSRRPLVKTGGPCSYGWKDMPNDYNLSFLVSLNTREQAGGSGHQRDSGEAILQYVPKALSAEPQ